MHWLQKFILNVWDPISSAPHYEEVQFEENFWDDMKRSLMIFFKQYVAKCLLRFSMIEYCGIFGISCLGKNEVETKSGERCKCPGCEATFHKLCCKDVASVCKGGLLNDLETSFDDVVASVCVFTKFCFTK